MKIVKLKTARKAESHITMIKNFAKISQDKLFINKKPSSYPCALVSYSDEQDGSTHISCSYIYSDLSSEDAHDSDLPNNIEW